MRFLNRLLLNRIRWFFINRRRKSIQSVDFSVLIDNLEQSGKVNVTSIDGVIELGNQSDEQVTYEAIESMFRKLGWQPTNEDAD